MFLVFLIRPMLLSIRAIRFSANINSPLADQRATVHHSVEYIPLNGAFERSPIWIIRVATFLDMRGFPASVAVMALPPPMF